MSERILSKEATELRERVVRALREQGFEIRKGRLASREPACKQDLRAMHRSAVIHRIEQASAGLRRHENRLLGRFAAGKEVNPANVRPRLVLVHAGSEDELLFRYARLHWSIPVSAGYGRRLRFVVYDESNDKLIGLFGLADPIFNLGPRDQWVGWRLENRKQRLQCVMDLFVLGAVPPYSQLLCGKLVALLSTSFEVQNAFKRKYGGDRSLIRGEPLDGRLALLTTTSALGRSSLYNRLRFDNQPGFRSVGFTRGSGEFHFANGVYRDLAALVATHAEPTAKHKKWGAGFRNRREIVRKALPLLGLSRELVYHGIQREIFVAPLATNTQQFLQGDHQTLRRYDRRADDIFDWFRGRWLLPRAQRHEQWKSFDPATLRIWTRG